MVFCGFVVVTNIAAATAEQAQHRERPERLLAGSTAVGAVKAVAHTFPVPWQSTQLVIVMLPLLPIGCLPVPLHAEQSCFLPCWPMLSPSQFPPLSVAARRRQVKKPTLCRHYSASGPQTKTIDRLVEESRRNARSHKLTLADLKRIIDD